MIKYFLLATLVVVSAIGNLQAQDDWHLVKSHDGAIEAMLPGPAKKKLDRKKTLAGTITTKVLEFHTDDVEFTITSTKLSKFLRRFANDEKLYKRAKSEILSKSYGEEKSLKEIEIDEVPARELHYEVVDFHDENHNGYQGVAVFVVLNDKVYVANAIMEKEEGNLDLKKFRDSIKINK